MFKAGSATEDSRLRNTSEVGKNLVGAATTETPSSYLNEIDKAVQQVDNGTLTETFQELQSFLCQNGNMNEVRDEQLASELKVLAMEALKSAPEYDQPRGAWAGTARGGVGGKMFQKALDDEF